MAENLAKFNNAMSQFQSGSDGINNYLTNRANKLGSEAAGAIAERIGISQEDKEALDEAVGQIGAAAPFVISAASKLKARAFGGKTVGKGAESGKATEAAKGEATETGEAAEGGEGAGEAAATGSEEAGAEAAGTIAKLPEAVRSVPKSPWESSKPAETAEKPNEGADGAGDEGGDGAAEAGEAGEGAGEAAGEGAAEAGAEGAGEAAGEGAAEAAGEGIAAESASLLSTEAVAAAIPVVGEVAVLAGAAYAAYEGFKSLFGGGSSEHKSAVRAAFSGDIAGSGDSTAFTSGSYAVASNDGITTQTGGSGAF